MNSRDLHILNGIQYNTIISTKLRRIRYPRDEVSGRCAMRARRGRGGSSVRRIKHVGGKERVGGGEQVIAAG